MAKKNTEITAEQATEALELLQQFVAQQGGETAETETEEAESEEKSEDAEESSEEEALELPSKEDLDEMDKASLIKLAEKLELDVAGLKEARIKELFSTLIDVLSEEAADADDVNALASAFGLKPAKKQKETEAGIREFIENLGGDEAEAEAEEGKDSDEDSDEDSEKEESKDADEDESEESEAEEVDEEEQEKRLEAYNKAAKKPLKKYADLVKLLGDNEWGTVYMGGKDEDEAYCCGLPLKEEEEVDGKSHGSCAVSGKHFLIDGEGNIEEYEVPEEKPAKKKLTIGKKK